MKKRIARILTLAMVLGLLTVNAMATDSYGPYSVTDENGDVYSFSSAKTESRTLNLYIPFEVFPVWPVENATVITVQPGSTLTIKNAQGGEFYTTLAAYNKTDAGYEPLDNIHLGFGGTDTLDGMFGENPDSSVPVDMLSFYVSYDATAGKSINAYILLGDGAAAPTAPAGSEQTTQPSTPAEPEQPAQPEQPVQPEQPEQPEQPAEPEQSAVPDAPGAYTVKKGDTMGQIALNYYGSYGCHRALYQANAEAFKATGGKLTPGMVLTLPETLGNASLLSAPAAGEGETLYTVESGDTLGTIAKTVYGDVMKYQTIFERNSDRLKNANTIYEGQIIVLPAK